jgi:hypothetical protein
VIAQEKIGNALLQKGQLDEGLASYSNAIRSYLDRGDQQTARVCFNMAQTLLEKYGLTGDATDRFCAEMEELLQRKTGTAQSQHATNN